MKKVLSFILVLSMVLGSFGMAFADTTQPKTAVDKMVELGFVKGDEGGLRLNDTIKRSEVATTITRVLGLEALATASNYQGRFTDVTPAYWANGNINVAAGRALVNGYPDGTFAPEGNITNNEAVTIMVRMVLNAEEIATVEKTGVWPSNYLVKAAELGLLEGINVANYGDAATRETVFTMAYNAYENLNEQEYYVVKALVLENDRVERIGANEVVVEVIEEVQRASFAEESRKEKGDQLRLEIPAELGNVEDLLGKALNISLDKNDKIVKLTVDESYQVVTGEFKAEAKKLTVDGKAYTVTLDERYNKVDDRVFRTYFNNKPYSYEEFYKDVTRAKGDKAADKFEADYARATVKNGKVVFIDAYKFDDIAPVKEVKKDGAEVSVYNDARDGGVKKFELTASAKVITVEEGVFAKAARKDIEANDVVHAYDGGYIVRKDAAVNGEFKKVSENKDGEVFVHVDDASFEVLVDGNKKPVYSYDSKDFYTLNANAADKVLKEFRGEKVTVLQDLGGRLQYIGSEIELGEFVALITNIVGKDIRVIKTDGTKAEYTATLDTKYEANAGTGHDRLNQFQIGDLVYLSVDDANIDKMVRIAEETDGVKVNALTTKDIELDVADAENQKNFRILSDTLVFVKTTKGYEVRAIKDVADAFKDNLTATTPTPVDAYVISGYVFDDKADPRRDVYSTSKTEAHTIVFTDIVIEADLDTEIVEFRGFADRQEKQMDVKYADGTTATLAVDKTVNTTGFKGGDILEIEVTKDTKKDIKSANRVIKAATKNEVNVFEVDSYDRQGNLTLVDAFGVQRTYYVTKDTVVFGNLSTAEKASFVLDGNTNYVQAILVRAKNTEVTGNFNGQTAVTAGTVTATVYGVTGDTVTFDVATVVDGTGIATGDQVTFKLTDRTILHTRATGNNTDVKSVIIAELLDGLNNAIEYVVEFAKDQTIVRIVK